MNIGRYLFRVVRSNKRDTHFGVYFDRSPASFTYWRWSLHILLFKRQWSLECIEREGIDAAVAEGLGDWYGW